MPTDLTTMSSYLNCSGRDQRPRDLPAVLRPIRARRGVDYRYVIAVHYNAAQELSTGRGLGIFKSTAHMVFQRFVSNDDLPRLLTVCKALVRCEAFVQDGDGKGVDSWFRQGPKWQEFIEASEPYAREWLSLWLPTWSAYRICGVLPTFEQQQAYAQQLLDTQGAQGVLDVE